MLRFSARLGGSVLRTLRVPKVPSTLVAVAVPQHRWISVTDSSHQPQPRAKVTKDKEEREEREQIEGKVDNPRSPLPRISWDLIESEQDTLYKSIEIEVLAYEPSVLDSYQWFVMTSASHLGIPIGKCWAPLKPDNVRFPLLKSAFVHKKHQVHYEIRTYHRFMTFHHLTGSTASTFIEYIQRNLPEGCGMKVTRVMVQPLPPFLKHKGQGEEGEKEGKEEGSQKKQNPDKDKDTSTSEDPFSPSQSQSS